MESQSEEGSLNNFVFITANRRIGGSNDKERLQCQIRDYDIHSESKLLETPKEIPNAPSDMSFSHYDDAQSSYSEIRSVSTGECCNVDQFDETECPIHEVTSITTHEKGDAVHHDINQEGNNCPENGDANHHDINQEGNNCLENGLGSSEEVDNVTTMKQSHTTRMKLKVLFLSNQLFVSRIEDLFNIQVYLELAPFEVDDSDQDSRALIYCTNDVLETKNLQFSLACLPLPRFYIAKSQNHLPLDLLWEEVCNDIEDLRCYATLVKNVDLPSDNLYALIDRDLRFKSETCRVGWRHMFTQDEVEQVIVRMCLVKSWTVRAEGRNLTSSNRVQIKL